MIDWPSGSKTGDQIRFDVNILSGADLYVAYASSYTDSTAEFLRPGKSNKIYVDYPKKIFVTVRAS